MLDLQKLVDIMNDQHATACEPGQWSIGMLVEFLEQQEGEKKIQLSADLISYRGYYNHIAIEPGESTCGELLARLKEALGGKVFTGYKGGDYTYSTRTPVWIADYGYCGPYLSGVDVSDGVVTPRLSEAA